MDLIIKGGSVVGAIGVIIGALIAIGLPMPATSQDIKRLDKSQADIAVDMYQRDVRDSIILRGTVSDPTTQKLIEQNLREAQEKLSAAQARKLELAK